MSVRREMLGVAEQLSNPGAFDTIRHVVDVEWSWRLACQEIPATKLLWEVETVPLDTLEAVAAYWQAEGNDCWTTSALSAADSTAR